MGRFLDESGNPTGDEAAAAKDPKTGEPVTNPARDIWISSTAFQSALNTAYFAERGHFRDRHGRRDAARRHRLPRTHGPSAQARVRRGARGPERRERSGRELNRELRVKPGRHRVLVAGGGVAAVEALLALRRLAGRRVELTLLNPEPEFAPRAASVAAPFGFGAPGAIPLAALEREFGAVIRRGALSAVDHVGRVALVDENGAIPYDTLVVAVGARPRRSRQAWAPWPSPRRSGPCCAGCC
jgi:hypothetical protein